MGRLVDMSGVQADYSTDGPIDYSGDEPGDYIPGVPQLSELTALAADSYDSDEVETERIYALDDTQPIPVVVDEPSKSVSIEPGESVSMFADCNEDVKHQIAVVMGRINMLALSDKLIKNAQVDSDVYYDLVRIRCGLRHVASDAVSKVETALPQFAGQVDELIGEDMARTGVYVSRLTPQAAYVRPTIGLVPRLTL
jgi:hypothetical protein